ncbi:MAG TPA: hypothetical protein DCP47_04065, partial [Phycisphaerales bacterium]|nr:hypothetical protein [Phycisphaerales bacterium]
ETGKEFEGNITIERPFALDEIPVYVKAGSIIPTMPKINRIDEKPLDTMILDIYPGDNGSISVYEDAGNDQKYKNEFAFTDINFVKKDSSIEINIMPIKGKFDGMLSSRNYQIRLINTFPPQSVSVNDREINFDYDGREVATIINIGKQSTSEKINIIVKQSNEDTAKLSGLKGKMKHLHRFVDFVGRSPQPRYEFESIISTSLTGTKMTYNPADAVDLVNNFETEYDNALEQIKSKTAKYPDWLPYLEWLQLR